MECSTKRMAYLNIPATFDIETTTIRNTRKSLETGKDEYIGFMYIWQFCLLDRVCMGRTWEEFQELLDKLREGLRLDANRRLVIYAHNLAFEFQFVRNFIDVESVFARKKRVPIKVEFNYAFEFRCSYFLSNMSLEKFVKNTPNAKFNKQSGENFDYKKVRLPNTKMTEEELGYCYCDVRGLSEAIQHLLKEDTIASMPLTSTGFLRREVRKAVLANPKNREEVKRCQLNSALYVMCKTAARGGNTHANPLYSNIIIDDMKSKDRKSSYPAEMVVDNYPVTAFRKVRPSRLNFDTLVGDKAVLMDITLRNVELNTIGVIPYIPLAKLTKVVNPICDNGRISSAAELSIVCTDIDWRIICSQYTFDKDFHINNLYYAEYGKLNNEFRKLLMDYFYQKEILNPDKNPNADPYIYAKFKNRINAFFGMMLTDICNPEIVYDPYADDIWGKGEINLDYMLSKHYNSRNTFLTYQHGIWVTANARKRLQDALDAVGEDAIYTDTDSVKYIGNHDADIKRVNDDWLATCENNDIKPYVEVYGERIYLGIWADEPDMKQFVTMGAKKYAYIKKGDDSNALNITVAGLNKEKGADYLCKLAKKKGVDPIQLFKRGTVIPAGSAGRTTAYYNDLDEPIEITVNGTKVVTGSNVAIVDGTYTFGISNDYFSYLFDLDPTRFDEYENENKGDLNYEDYFSEY